MGKRMMLRLVDAVFCLSILLFFPLNVQGCVMVEPVSAEQPLIQQILLKPAENTLLDDQGRLSPEYIRNLQDSLQSGHKNLPAPDMEVYDFQSTPHVGPIPRVHESRYVNLHSMIQLSYIRPMSGGVHVLGIEPGLTRNDVSILTEQLTADESVEYAEPDFPRRRR